MPKAEATHRKCKGTRQETCSQADVTGDDLGRANAKLSGKRRHQAERQRQKRKVIKGENDLERQDLLGDTVIGDSFTVQNHAGAALLQQLGHISSQVWILGRVVLAISTAPHNTSMWPLSLQVLFWLF